MKRRPGHEWHRALALDLRDRIRFVLSLPFALAGIFGAIGLEYVFVLCLFIFRRLEIGDASVNRRVAPRFDRRLAAEVAAPGPLHLLFVLEFIAVRGAGPGEFVLALGLVFVELQEFRLQVKFRAVGEYTEVAENIGRIVRLCLSFLLRHVSGSRKLFLCLYAGDAAARDADLRAEHRIDASTGNDRGEMTVIFDALEAAIRGEQVDLRRHRYWPQLDVDAAGETVCLHLGAPQPVYGHRLDEGAWKPVEIELAFLAAIRNRHSIDGDASEFLVNSENPRILVLAGGAPGCDPWQPLDDVLDPQADRHFLKG